MFVRFVECEDDDPYWMTGIVAIAKEMRDDGKLYPYEVSVVGEVFGWLNENLPCPPFKENQESGKWTSDAVSWFRDDAKDLITRMWEIVAVLKEHGVPVRVLKTDNPGKIVYSDKYQVVAEFPLGDTNIS